MDTNEIFLSYGLYHEVICDEKNPLLNLQKIKAEFRIGNYDSVIEFCHKILDIDVPIKISMETMYYMSSALYYKGDYINAMEATKECVIIGWRKKDMDFYLNSLINFASIQYVYASTFKGCSPSAYKKNT